MPVNLNKILRIIEKLELPDRVIIVEGKKDINALKEAGVKNKIISANKANIKKIRRKKAILLFDFDRGGEKKLRLYKDLCEINGINAETETRNEMRKLLDFSTFEEFYYALKRAIIEAAEGKMSIPERLKKLVTPNDLKNFRLKQFKKLLLS